jgi:hypothetical protein
MLHECVPFWFIFAKWIGIAATRNLQLPTVAESADGDRDSGSVDHGKSS